MKIKSLLFCMIMLILAFPVRVHAAFALSELEDTTNDFSGEAGSNVNEIYAELAPMDYTIDIQKNINVKITSGIGVMEAEATLYDIDTESVLYKASYSDSNAPNKEVLLTVHTTNVPISKLALICVAKNKRATKQFSKTYGMPKNEISVTAANTSGTQIKDWIYQFNVKCKYTKVPLKEVRYTFKDKNGNAVKEGAYTLNDDTYSINPERGEIVFKPAYNFSSDTETYSVNGNRSEVIVQTTLDMPTNQKVTCVVEAEDILGNKYTSTRSFNLIELEMKIVIKPKTDQTVKIGDIISVDVTALNKATRGNAGKGIKKTVLNIYDGTKLAKTYSTVEGWNEGRGTMTASGALVPITGTLSVEVIVTDIANKTTTVKQTYNNVNKDVKNVEPIFRLGTNRRVAGTTENVTVTSNADVKFTSATVKIVDENGNLLKSFNGNNAIGTATSAAGSTALYPYVRLPGEYHKEVYYIFSAKAGDVTFEDLSDFDSISSVYKKGPYTIYDNKVKIETKPSGGRIDRTSNIDVTVSCSNTDFKVKEATYYWEAIRNEAGTYYTVKEENRRDGEQWGNYCIDGGYNSAGTPSWFYNYKWGSVETRVEDGLLYVKPKKIPAGLEKPGYNIVWRPAIMSGTEWRVNGYYVIGEGRTEEAIYDMATGYRVIKKETKTINANSDTFTAELPNELYYNMYLKVVAKDQIGDTDTAQFAYDIQWYTIDILPSIRPEAGKLTSGTAITADVKTQIDTVRLKRIEYEVSDYEKVYTKQSTDLNYESGGKLFSVIIPDVSSERKVTVKFSVYDENGRVFVQPYEYTVTPRTEEIDYSKFISADFLGGKIEYILEYYTIGGNLITAVLDEYTASTYLFYNYNVKDMQISTFSGFINRLTEKGYPAMADMSKFNALYTKLTLDYSLMYQSKSGTAYIPENKELVLYAKNEKALTPGEDGKEEITYNKVVSDDYKKLTEGKVLENEIGVNAKVGNMFTESDVTTILEKVQSQIIKELDLSDLPEHSIVLDPIYEPESLINGVIPKIIKNGTVSFNNEYINSKKWLNANDMTNGLAINVNPNPFENVIHYLLKYYVADYTFTEEYRANDHVHTAACGPIVVDVDGVSHYTGCSEPEQILWTIYKTVYRAAETKTNEIEPVCVTQTAIPFTEYGYIDESGTPIYVGQGHNFYTDQDGKLKLIAKSTWKPKSFDEMFKIKTGYVEGGKGNSAYDVDTAYPHDGEVVEFTATAVLDNVKIDAAAPTVKLMNNQYIYQNSYNSDYYERSSDRGNTILLKIDDSQDITDDGDDTKENVSGVKKITVKWKYGDVEEQTEKEFTGEKAVQNNVEINIPANAMKKGGLVEIRVFAQDNAGNVSSGKLYYKNEFIDFKLYINTAKNVNALENGKSLIIGSGLSNAGAVDSTVANLVCEGKPLASGETTALRIEGVYDNSWQRNVEENNCNTDSMGLYLKNGINDTIGLGYKLDFSMNTVGFGQQSEDKSDLMLVNVLFFGKTDSTGALKEVEPYIEKTTNKYEKIELTSPYRVMKMFANKVNKGATNGLTSIIKNADGTVKWNFSYYLPHNVKFKVKNATPSAEYLTLGEVAVAFDIELYKWYSIEGSNLVTNGGEKDSRHLYTLREDKWAASTSGNRVIKNKLTIKNEDINIKGINTTKGLVFWYDILRDVTFDIKGERY